MCKHFDLVASDWDSEQYRHDRAKAVADQLCAQIEFHPGMTALEFGAGTGLFGFNLLSHFAFLTFADASEGMLEKVNEKIRKNHIQNADTLLLDSTIRKLPQQYDCIFSLMTLHHIPDYESTIQTFAVHVKPKGFLCIADLDRDDGSFHADTETAHHGLEREHVKRLFAICGLEQINGSTPYTMKKEIRGIQKEFTLFLITGQKP